MRKEIKALWHEFWEEYHYKWLIKHHGRFPNSRSGCSVYVNHHFDRYWHHRFNNI